MRAVTSAFEMVRSWKTSLSSCPGSKHYHRPTVHFDRNAIGHSAA